MQDIISTLKNALQQAEAGLEVAVGRLAKDGTERGEFQPSEVLALSCVREALAMPVTCLHQIQEPSAAEQAAWHAGLDEDRAQAAGSVSNATCHQAKTGFTVSNAETPQVAPTAVAVPDEQELRKLKGLMLEVWACAKPHPDVTNEQLRGILGRCLPYIRALAATPAADAPLDFLPFSARAAIASRHGMKVTAEFNALVREVIAEYRARAVPSDIAAAAPVVLPEPDAGFVPAAAYDRLQALCDSQAAHILAFEDAPAAVPVHWLAVLDPEQAPQQLKTSMHAVGFRNVRSAEAFIAEQLDFNSWRYTLKPLYAAPQAATATGLPAQAVEPSDAELIALNAGECFFSESPTKYPELGHGTQYHGGAPGVIGFARAALELRADPAAHSKKFQQRVHPWMMACFGTEISADRIERNHRFLEEALELVQSCGCTASEAHQLVDYVYGRPWGEPAQEAGGVMVTLAALCLANGLDMHACGETELARIWTMVEAIRAKQAAKPKHSPLPMHVPEAQADARDAERWRAATRNMEINDVAVVIYNQHGNDRTVTGDEADAAIDAAIAAQAAQGGE